VPALVKVEVSGLLGQFEHVIDFPPDAPFVVLHGPNGVGKTKLLELINAAIKLDLGYIDECPFASLTITFDDESALTVRKTEVQGSTFPDVEETWDGEDLKFQFEVHRSGSHRSWKPDLLDPEVKMLFRGMRQRVSVGSNQASLRELQRAWIRLRGPDRGASFAFGLAPDWLVEFVRSIEVHLIETQRLLIFEPDIAPSPHPGAREQERRGRRNTVAEFADDLARQISGALARNSRTSQQLDGTFPRRVLSQTPPGPEVTDELIRERYLKQTQLRETLNEISVLDDQDDLPLPGGRLEPWQRRVLWIYLEDSERKLLTFRDLLDRITLLREIVNSRFLNKTLIVDRDKGFRFETKLGQQLDPTQLSSGEQNELVLVYNLLFKVSEGSVVLIDEPEISLHIAWQQKFLEDVQRISQISHLRFIIATHSPQIVHKWWSRAVALGPGLDPEDQLV